MRQVVWEVQLGSEQEAALQDALLQRLAEKEPGFYGRPGPSRPMSKGAAPGAVRRHALLLSTHDMLLNGACPATTG